MKMKTGGKYVALCFMTT